MCARKEQCFLIPGSCLIGLVLVTVKNIYTGCKIVKGIHTYCAICNPSSSYAHLRRCEGKRMGVCVRVWVCEGVGV